MAEFGSFGGQYVPESLMSNLKELEKTFNKSKKILLLWKIIFII